MSSLSTVLDFLKGLGQTFILWFSYHRGELEGKRKTLEALKEEVYKDAISSHTTMDDVRGLSDAAAHDELRLGKD